MRLASLVVLVVVLAACGSAPPPRAETAPAQMAEAQPEAEAPVEESPRETYAVQGITGSLSDSEAHQALDPRMDSFARCFLDQASSLRQLGGDVRLHIRVGIDGMPVAAYPEDSTVGHRDVERCLSDVAMHTRFPRPRGGEARLTWPISMDPPENVRHPATWDPSRIANVLERNAPRVIAQCEERALAVQVTAYVRRGRVVQVGAASREEAGADTLDCVVEQVRGWDMPPAPRMTKVTFDLTPPTQGLASL